jgi:hypothetical protein
MANRVLLGKGRLSSETEYGLWVSKSGQNVLTCGDDQLLFDSTIDDSTSGVSSSNGQSLVLLQEGTMTGTGSATPVSVTFPVFENDDGNVACPFVLYGATSSGDSYQHIGTWYNSSASATTVYGGIFSIGAGPFNSSGGTYSSGTKYGKVQILYAPSDRVFSYALFYAAVQE